MWDYPGAVRFLSAVVDSLESGKHVMVVCPEPLRRANPLGEIGRVAFRRGIGSLTRIRVGPEVRPDPLEALTVALELPPPHPVEAEDLFSRTDVPSSLIALEGVDEGDDTRQFAFSRLLLRAGVHAQVAGDVPFCAITLVSPHFPLPSANVRLDHHVWWGCAGRADLDLAVERAFEDFPPPSATDWYWGWALCRGIGGWDVRLVRQLAESLPRNLEEITTLLQEGHGSDLDDLPDFNSEKHPFSLLGDRVPPPPRDGDPKRLWDMGFLDWVPGQGLVEHSTLPALQGRSGVLERRIWSGQMDLVMPLIERVRLSLIRWLERQYGESWPKVLGIALSLEADEAVHSEIGALAHHAFRHPPGGSAGRCAADLAWAWRDIRNQLAHVRPLSYEMLEYGITLFQAFLRNC